MRHMHIKQIAEELKYSTSLLGCMAAMLVFSCSSVPTTVAPSDTLPVLYSLVFVIHGDGDYLYHDRRGNAYRADERMLAEATAVAIQNPHAEVFIFHEKPRSRFLLFFPRPDGEFYYFQNGKLITNESYRRDNTGFVTEAQLYHRDRQQTQRNAVKLFLYFGHEIPEAGGEGYDASYPERSFTIQDFKASFAQLTSDSTKFDLVVLSTCFNGTPYTVANLSDYARYIIASPDNLHLSYFDVASLKRLETVLAKENISDFAGQFAQHAFDRLAPEIQTAITVAVYDVKRVQEYIQAVKNPYAEALASMQNAPTLPTEHCDCADDPAYTLPAMSNGVYVLYRPPRFGRAKNKLAHSGWECWKKSELPQGN